MKQDQFGFQIYNFSHLLGVLIQNMKYQIHFVGTLTDFNPKELRFQTWTLIRGAPVYVLLLSAINPLFNRDLVVRSGDLVSYCAEEGVRILGEGKFFVSDSFPGNERTKYCLTSKIISAITGGITDLSFDTMGYAWQISNCVLTESYSLTLRRVMDKAKLLTDAGSLNEVSMVLLNNLLSLPFVVFLILLFDEWNYVIKADVVRMPMFWVVATASGVLGLSISFTSMWFLNQTGPTTYRC